MKQNKRTNVAAVCRWLARIIGSLLVILTVFLAIGEGMPNLFTQPIRVQVGFLALALIIIGILAGWRWEFSGGTISLFGWCLFVLAVIGSLKHLNWFVIGLALPGASYLTSALLRRYQERHSSA